MTPKEVLYQTFLLYHWNTTKSYVSVDPLSFEDVEGGFYLLGAGFAVSIFVHVFMIFMIKMQDSCNTKKIMMNNKKG